MNEEDLLNPNLSALAFASDARDGALPETCRVVVVGAGIVGTSVAYHLAALGVEDVLLIERASTAAGASWHAAGLVNKARGTHALTELSSYGVELYARLGDETGIATGFNQCGSLTLARTPARMDELRYAAMVARHHHIETHLVPPSALSDLWPLASQVGLEGASHQPLDGTVNPGWSALALAKGAWDKGVAIREGVSVLRLLHSRGKVQGVVTDRGAVESETVVLCAGMWSRDLAAAAGVSLPLYAAEHTHVTTEPIDGVLPTLPILRDLDGFFYIRHYRGSLVVGAFEPDGKPRPMQSIADDFAFAEFDPDWEHFESTRARAVKRVPVLGGKRFERFLCAPESFTPDLNFLLGETAELAGLFTACGMNSQGVVFAPGAGRTLAEWIVEGAPTVDVAAVDCTRFAPAQATRRYLHARTREGLGRLYGMHWPHLQPVTARNVRRTPLYERLARANACFGELNGWERPNWYAPPGVAPIDEYSYGRQNWFEHSGKEHQAARERVALFDLSSFAKFEVAGPDACDLLQRACTQDIDVEPGRVTYSLICNARGGIELDGTVTRLSEDRFLVVTPTVTQHKTLHTLRRLVERHHPAVGIHDATSSFAVLAVMGPSSRDLLSRISPSELGNASFPWSRSRQIEVADALALALRVSFVGELGWELYVPTEYAVGVYDAIIDAGAEFDLAHAGFHALDSLRAEKGYRHLGHDIGASDDPYQAGLGFAVSLSKSADFVGRQALSRLAQEPPTRRQVFVRLDDPGPILLGAERIMSDGAVLGRLTSASYGHTLGAAVGLGYVKAEAFADGPVEIDAAGTMIGAMMRTTPFYDPLSLRLREKVAASA